MEHLCASSLRDSEFLPHILHAGNQDELLFFRTGCTDGPPDLADCMRDIKTGPSSDGSGTGIRLFPEFRQSDHSDRQLYTRRRVADLLQRVSLRPDGLCVDLWIKRCEGRTLR